MNRHKAYTTDAIKGQKIYAFMPEWDSITQVLLNGKEVGYKEQIEKCDKCGRDDKNLILSNAPRKFSSQGLKVWVMVKRGFNLLEVKE